MPDLIQEFFERELNESESDSLGILLQESPDEALRFEGLLESHYLATGLPLPQLPSTLQSLPLNPGGMGAAGVWKILALVAAAGAGFIAWKFWPTSEVVQPMATKSPAPGSQIPIPKIKKSPSWSVQDPAAVGEELSVVVDTPEKSLVTVRVLDAAGREVRHLFTGFVEPGERSFQWDGNLSAGEPAPPGGYKIDVQTGGSHQIKDIRLNLK